MIHKIAKEVEKEFQMGGLSTGIYYDFAETVADRYAYQKLLQFDKWCEKYSIEDTKLSSKELIAKFIKERN